MVRKISTICLLIALNSVLFAQNFNIGIRAGSNFSKIKGPLISEGFQEKMNVNSSVHLGINFKWNFTPTFGLMGEIVFSQLGTKYSTTGLAYYRAKDIYISTKSEIVRDSSKYKLDITNTNFMFPIVANIKLSKKFEVFGGMYFSLLSASSGKGTLVFGSDYGKDFQDPDNPLPPHYFQQELDYDYKKDVVGAAKISFNQNSSSFENDALAQIIVNGENIDLARTIGAYYLLDEPAGKQPKLFKGSDYGLVGGINYFINTGLYIGARLEYGLRDITNNDADFRVDQLTVSNSFVKVKDFDRNYNVAISLGFRF